MILRWVQYLKTYVCCFVKYSHEHLLFENSMRRWKHRFALTCVIYRPISINIMFICMFVSRFFNFFKYPWTHFPCGHLACTGSVLPNVTRLELAGLACLPSWLAGKLGTRKTQTRNSTIPEITLDDRLNNDAHVDGNSCKISEQIHNLDRRLKSRVELETCTCTLKTAHGPSHGEHWGWSLS